MPESRKLNASLHHPAEVDLTKPARTVTAPKRGADQNESKEMRPTEVTETESESPPQFRGNDFISPDQVDELASAEDVPELLAPPDQQDATGHILMKIFVDATGAVAFIEVEQNTLPETYAQLLVERSYLAKFRPAQLSGEPIKSWRRVEVRIGDENIEAASSLTKPTP